MPKGAWRIQQPRAGRTLYTAGGSNYFDLFVRKFLIDLVAARQFERIRHCGFAFFHAGDYVGAAEPVCFGEISLRPARGMVGMRVIEPDNVFSALPALPLNPHQFAGIDVIAILRRVSARVSA